MSEVLKPILYADVSEVPRPTEEQLASRPRPEMPTLMDEIEALTAGLEELGLSEEEFHKLRVEVFDHYLAPYGFTAQTMYEADPTTDLRAVEVFTGLKPLFDAYVFTLTQGYEDIRPMFWEQVS